MTLSHAAFVELLEACDATVEDVFTDFEPSFGSPCVGVQLSDEYGGVRAALDLGAAVVNQAIVAISPESAADDGYAHNPFMEAVRRTLREARVERDGDQLVMYWPNLLVAYTHDPRGDSIVQHEPWVAKS